MIQLEAALDGTDLDTACQTLARQYGLDIDRPKMTAKSKAEWFFQKRIEQDYDDYKKEQANYYLQLSTLYRNIKDVPELTEMASDLEQWLDENINGVVQPWIYRSIQ